jgi:hypothetical protein
MKTYEVTTKQLMDELAAAAYEFALARNRYDELHKVVKERLAEMRKQVEEAKQRLADTEEETKENKS